MAEFNYQKIAMEQVFDSDISLKELFTRIGDYFSTIMSSWKTVILTGVVTGIMLAVLHLGDTNQYRADLTFMLNEDETGNMGGLTGLLGQFGLGMNGGESNLDKIMELSKARKITQDALFEEAELNGESDLLANHIISSLSNAGEWKEKGLLSFLGGKDSLNISEFRFSHPDVASFNDIENKALKRLHQKMVGRADADNNTSGGLFSSGYSELTGIMSFSMVSDNPDLSILTVNRLFENLSRYYIKKATEKQKYDYKIIKNKYDSIVNRLSNVQYELAAFQDGSFNVFRKTDLLTEKRLRTEEQKLGLMLGEAEKQVQIAGITLENKTPYIQLIDSPIKPLRPINKSSIYYLIFGGILGSFLCVAFLACRKMYRDIMNS